MLVHGARMLNSIDPELYPTTLQVVGVLLLTEDQFLHIIIKAGGALKATVYQGDPEHL